MIQKNMFARAAIAISLVAGAQIAVAGQVVAGDTIKLATTPKGTLAGIFQGSALTGTGGSFLTFCLEKFETFSPGATLYVKGVTNATVNATSSYYTAKNPLSGGSANSDPLSGATEWLFTKFSTNASFKSMVSGTDAKANSFQRAVWFLEYELENSADKTAYLADTDAKQWVSDAKAAVTGGWTDSGNHVRVLNLFKDKAYTQHSQDQLYFVSSVPEPESYAMMLVGLGLMGAIARRRSKNSA